MRESRDSSKKRINNLSVTFVNDFNPPPPTVPSHGRLETNLQLTTSKCRLWVWILIHLISFLALLFSSHYFPFMQLTQLVYLIVYAFCKLPLYADFYHLLHTHRYCFH